MNSTTKNQVYLWAVGLGIIVLFVWAGVLFSQARSISLKYTEPGIADYQSGNYVKAIQELNTSIKLDDGGNSYAYYYLGLSLKKTGDVIRARRAFLEAKSAGYRQKNVNPAFIDRCDKAINDIDDGH